MTGFDCDQSKFFGPEDQMLALGSSAEIWTDRWLSPVCAESAPEPRYQLLLFTATAISVRDEPFHCGHWLFAPLYCLLSLPFLILRASSCQLFLRSPYPTVGSLTWSTLSSSDGVFICWSDLGVILFRNALALQHNVRICKGQVKWRIEKEDKLSSSTVSTTVVAIV